jgi:predicted nucleic acid-binding protein
MSAIVIDASVLVAALVDAGPQGTWSEHVLSGGGLHAPELVLVEASNVLRRLELSHEITGAAANAAYQDLLQLHLELFPYEPFAGRIWELRHGITSYDAWYVAVAEALELPLATLDKRLSRSKGPVCGFLTPKTVE